MRGFPPTFPELPRQVRSVTYQILTKISSQWAGNWSSIFEEKLEKTSPKVCQRNHYVWHCIFIYHSTRRDTISSYSCLQITTIITCLIYSYGDIQFMILNMLIMIIIMIMVIITVVQRSWGCHVPGQFCTLVGTWHRWKSANFVQSSENGNVPKTFNFVWHRHWFLCLNYYLFNRKWLLTYC